MGSAKITVGGNRFNFSIWRLYEVRRVKKKKMAGASDRELFTRGGVTYDYSGPTPIELRPLKIYNLKNAKLIYYKDTTCSVSKNFDREFVFETAFKDFEHCFNDNRSLDEISIDFVNKKDGKLYLGSEIDITVQPHRAENGPFYLYPKESDKRVEIVLTSDDSNILLCFIGPRISKKQYERCEKHKNSSNDYSSFYIKSPALGELNSLLADYVEGRLKIDKVVEHINAGPLNFGKDAVERLAKMKNRLECNGSVLKKVFVEVKANTQPESSFSYLSAYTFGSNSERDNSRDSTQLERADEIGRIKKKYKM